MTKPYPLRFKPVFKPYIWGGRNLERYGRRLPDTGVIAESWEISSHKEGMSYITNGFYAGKALQDVLELLDTDLVGTNNLWAIKRGKFPLLVKLLDAQTQISVQVHPDDDYAGQHEGNELGKTEMWLVLEARQDAAIIYGLSQEVSPLAFYQAINSGTLEKYLHRLRIRKGDFICIPAGTIHSILGGAVLAEIQQNSNTTYRVFDWNRVGSDGQPRALHIEKAMDVIIFDQFGLKLPSPDLIEKNTDYSREVLCRNQYFTTERIYLNMGASFSGFCDGSTMEIWGVLSGQVSINSEVLSKVEFSLLPANLRDFKVRADRDSVLLRAYVE